MNSNKLYAVATWIKQVKVCLNLVGLRFINLTQTYSSELTLMPFFSSDFAEKLNLFASQHFLCFLEGIIIE